ncbi:MAG: hypothetical protein ACO3A4_14130 [Silvanigrellaceae bacterium]
MKSLSVKSAVVYATLAMSSVACSNGNDQLISRVRSPAQAGSNSSVTGESTVVANVKNNSSADQTKATQAGIAFEISNSESGSFVDLASISQARSAGYTDEQIVASLNSQKLFMSSAAANALAQSKFILKQYGVQDVNGVLAMGLAAVERARVAGVKDSEIIAYSKLQGISFGVEALKSLGLSKFILANHGVQDVNGVLAMGLAAVERARAAGAKDSEIIAYSKLQGVRFGVNALNSLGLSKFVLSQYGTAVVDGVTAMGLAAVERAKANGLSHEDIKAYAKLQDIFFGEKALALLGS